MLSNSVPDQFALSRYNPVNHMGESQANSINQFHEESSLPVGGLLTETILRISKGKVVLKDAAGAKILRR